MLPTFLDTGTREYARIPLNGLATIKLDHHVLTGDLENISLKGALVRASEVLEVGTLVSLTISAPDSSHELSGVRAKVIRVAGGRMGLQFIGFDGQEDPEIMAR